MSAPSATLHSEAPQRDTEFAFTMRDFRQIAEILRGECGIVLGDNKVNLVYSRLAKRLRALKFMAFRDYCEFVVSDAGIDERKAMIAAMTTNVTRFFREPHHFDHLRDEVLPTLGKQARSGQKIRIWSAGCSSGEEPFSIAMTVLAAIPDACGLDVKILATDLDHNMIAHGRAGVYDSSAADSIPKEYRKYLETPEDGAREQSVQMSDKVRSLIRFNELNLLGAWPMAGIFDVIFCRNVMIYFDDDTQLALCRRYVGVLPPGGTLFIGHSERIEGNLPLTLTGQTTYVKSGGRIEMTPVRVLIVDDSATIRHILSMALARDPEIEVIGAAPGPQVARQMIKELNPDVITLDIEMPNMSGLEFLEKIMRLHPMPVVMVSTLTERGAGVTLDALAMGAVDYYPKPKENVAATLERAGNELALKIKSAARARVRARAPKKEAPSPKNGAVFKPSKKIVAIGSSTGGVEALLEVLSHFPENCPPTVITQHMPGKFTATFAERLDKLCKPSVAEAKDGAPLRTGQVYLAPGGEMHMEIGGQSNHFCRLRNGDLVSGHRPSVDVLFDSVARNAGANCVGVILTGMGRDGASGLKAMRDAGARTIGQDEESAVVYGMPRVAFEIGAVERQLPLEKIGEGILNLCSSEGGA